MTVVGDTLVAAGGENEDRDYKETNTIEIFEDGEWRLREEDEGVPRGRHLFDERTPLLSPVVIYGSAPRSHKTRVS